MKTGFGNKGKKVSALEQAQIDAELRRRATSDLSSLLLGVPYPVHAAACDIMAHDAEIKMPVDQTAMAVADWTYSKVFVPQVIVLAGDMTNVPAHTLVAVTDEMLKPRAAVADSVRALEVRREIVDGFLSSLSRRLVSTLSATIENIWTLGEDMTRRTGSCVLPPSTKNFAWAMVTKLFDSTSDDLNNYFSTGDVNKCLRLRRDECAALEASALRPRSKADNDNGRPVLRPR